jgi:hypothetical protein
VPGLPGNALPVALIGRCHNPIFRPNCEWLSPQRGAAVVGVVYGFPELTWLRLGRGQLDAPAAAASR